MSKNIKILLIGLCLIGIILVNLGVAGAAGSLATNWMWPTHIDPAVGHDSSSTAALPNLYDSLAYPTVKGDVQPHVAKSWETSADGLTWIFHLRPGIKFHDGTELTAEDVKFSMDRLLTIGEGFAYLFVGKISSTEVLDRYTVAFHLNRRFGPLPMALVRFYILNKDLVMANIKKPGPYDDMSDYGKGYLLIHDAGSGPYMMKEFRFEEYLLMVKNPNYWQPIDPQAPDEFKMIGVTQVSTIKTMMSRRELDIVDLWQSRETTTALDKIKGIDIGKYFMGYQYILMTHNRKPPTDDIHFRKAMAWAMDYKTLVDKIFPGSIQAKGPVPHSLPGADPTVFQYHRDLDKAMAELKQSKYYGQLDKYPVTVHYGITNVPMQKTGLLFMSNMADIGIRVQLTGLPWMSRLAECTSEDMEVSSNIQIMFVGPPYADAGQYLSMRYGSKSVASTDQNEWLLDPKFDAMIADAFEITDQTERFAKYSEIEHYIVDLCPSIWLIDRMWERAYQSAYVDWPAARGEVIPYDGYNLAARFIKVYPDKRAELLK